jgi:hypothetical protein
LLFFSQLSIYFQIIFFDVLWIKKLSIDLCQQNEETMIHNPIELARRIAEDKRTNAHNQANDVHSKIGGIAKGNRIVRIADRRENLEDAFMRMAFKSNRADAQRESRRAKR